jgi:hypothetical protein
MLDLVDINQVRGMWIWCEWEVVYQKNKDWHYVDFTQWRINPGIFKGHLQRYKEANAPRTY